MMHHRRTLVALTLGSVAAIAGCGRDLVAPRTDNALKPSSVASADKNLVGPTFLNPADGAPAIANPVIAFWAVKGRDQIVKMVYHSRANGGGASGDDGHRRGGNSGGGSSGRGANGGGTSGRDSVVFAQFRVRAKSLVSRADGSPIADGDSVLITMTLVDPLHGVIDFQPSGLRFSTKNPPQLKLSYENANPDLNGDGVVDARDRLIQLTFHIGVRESPNDPFLSLPSVVDTDFDEVEAEILGFSGYAIEF